MDWVSLFLLYILFIFLTLVLKKILMNIIKISNLFNNKSKLSVESVIGTKNLGFNFFIYISKNIIFMLTFYLFLCESYTNIFTFVFIILWFWNQCADFWRYLLIRLFFKLITICYFHNLPTLWICIIFST